MNNTLRSRFNHAAQLFSQQQYQEALEAYQGIFAPENDGEIETPSEAFCLEVRLRVGFCFIELNQLPEARFEFESEATLNLLTHAGPAQLEAYFFSFGNLLAKMGLYQQADQLLVKAQEIASTQLNNTDAVDRVCRYRLHWANHYEQWSTLLDLAQQFRGIAQKHGLVGLMHWSSEAVCFALRGLHQYAEAKHGAEQICDRLQKSGARSEHVAVWTKFISDLSA